MIESPKGHRHQDQVDLSLVKLLVKAHHLKEIFFNGGGTSIQALAQKEGVNPSYFTRLIRLTFLAPDIVQAILEGSHPVTLTASQLIMNTRFPYDWDGQRKQLGFL